MDHIPTSQVSNPLGQTPETKVCSKTVRSAKIIVDPDPSSQHAKLTVLIGYLVFADDGAFPTTPVSLLRLTDGLIWMTLFPAAQTTYLLYASDNNQNFKITMLDTNYYNVTTQVSVLDGG